MNSNDNVMKAICIVVILVCAATILFIHETAHAKDYNLVIKERNSNNVIDCRYTDKLKEIDCAKYDGKKIEVWIGTETSKEHYQVWKSGIKF